VAVLGTTAYWLIDTNSFYPEIETQLSLSLGRKVETGYLAI
jgi:hypothetical protein